MQAMSPNNDHATPGATRRGISIVGLGLVVPLLIVAGCGDSDDSEGAAAPLPKQVFVAQADRVCADASEQYDAVVATVPRPREFMAPDAPRSVIAEAGTAGAPLAEIEAELEGRLRSLTPPAEFAPRWDKALDALARRAVSVSDAGEAAEAGDQQAFVASFERFARDGTVGSVALRGYGFEVCGQ
jgi:hypothetical protein